jgi:hypothetical protein
MILQKNHKVVYMTPVELEAIRLKLGLSVAAMGRVLGLNVVTLHNMRAGRQRIRQFNALSLRWLEALWEIDRNHPSLPLELRAANDNFQAGEQREVE